MTALDADAEFNRADEKPPFANGFEGDMWMSAWCERCAHYEDCPLILVAVMGRTPFPWVPDEPGSLTRRYTCARYTAP
jgi:hypothetical protein